jgi:hypothetical protein
MHFLRKKFVCRMKLRELPPPAKKTRLPEEAAARPPRGSERVAVVQIPLVTLYISTRSLTDVKERMPPAKKIRSFVEVDTRSARA